MTLAVTAVSGQLGGEIARKLVARPGRRPSSASRGHRSNAQDAGDRDPPRRLRPTRPARRLPRGCRCAGARLRHGPARGSHRPAPQRDRRRQGRRGEQDRLHQHPGPRRGHQLLAGRAKQPPDRSRYPRQRAGPGRSGATASISSPTSTTSTATARRARSPTAPATGGAATPPASELAHAYAALLTRSDHDGQTVNLNGTPITQADLARYLNSAFGTGLTLPRQ